MTNAKSLRTLGVALACAAITFSHAVCAQAQTVTYLANFNGRNGSVPGPVIQATDGNFYGTTFAGGTHSKGNVFRMTPTGEITSIYSFCSQANCADGQAPFTAPVLGSDGNLYGVTSLGGKNAGVIYKLTLGGKITILHTFCSSSCDDGDDPTGLTLGSDGNFYGTTTSDGKFDSGTVFQISPTGNFKLLHTFCSLANCADGGIPTFPPMQGSDGKLYGGTNAGGTGGFNGGGEIYQLALDGTFKVIQNFCYGFSETCFTGAYPSGLLQDDQGNFFGTNSNGGSYDSGTVFEITSTNKFVGLHRFIYGGKVAPSWGLTLASDGNLYGVATDDANFASATGNKPSIYGIIFRITPAGEFTTLASFYNGPSGPLFQGTDGNLYGTTGEGGPGDSGYGYGTVYKISIGSSPMVKTVPTAGKVGKQVLILGNGLTGTSSVTFSSVPAAFTVESDTYIKATVPKGATTGVVSVVTPAGTLNSNPQFVVTK